MMKNTIETKKALSMIELAGSMNEFHVAACKCVSCDVRYGVSLRVHSISKKGKVNRKSYWVPASEAGCITADDRLKAIVGVKPEQFALIAKFDFFQDLEGDFISKEDFAELQEMVRADFCAARKAKGDLKTLRGSVLRMEQQLGLFDPMREFDRMEASYGSICSDRVGKSVYEAIVERYAM